MCCGLGLTWVWFGFTLGHETEECVTTAAGFSV